MDFSESVTTKPMKLAEALRIAQRGPVDAAPLVAFLACGFEPLHLKTFLAAHLRLRLERSATIETGLFDDLVGNVDRLRQAKPGLGIVVVEWADLDPRLGVRRLGGWDLASLPDILESSVTQLQRLGALLESAARSAPIVLVPPSLPLPPVSPYPPGQASPFELKLEQALGEFLANSATLSRVKVVDSRKLDAISPRAERFDVRAALGAGFPYRLSHAAQLASTVATLAKPAPRKKGLITDLDNTLWRGIVGDDGSASVGWGSDPRSHAHGIYQQVLGALASSGVLLAIASKNDPGPASAALAREDMLVSGDRFFPQEIHWQPKSESVARILDAWNLGPDSVVFVDDSPIELAEVAAAHPNLECIRFPAGDEQAIYDLAVLLRGLFNKDAHTAEDELRLASLRGRAEMLAARPTAPADQEEFLAQLDAELTIQLNPPLDDPRPLELINKTNQFNLNGRRISEGDYQTLRDQPTGFMFQVLYQDKFGALGKVAVIIGHRSPTSPRCLRITTWVMSCRAFSRRIEHRCVQYLFDHFDVDELAFELERTERNGPTIEFFESILGPVSDEICFLRRDRFVAPLLTHRLTEVENE